MSSKNKKNTWGFDARNIDASVRPQDDFFRYANGGWLKKNKIPAAESRWGTFIMLRYDTEKKLRVILKDLLKKRHRKGTHEQLVADMYCSAADLPAREKLGAKPVAPFRTQVAGIETRAEFLKCLASFHRLGVDAFFAETVDQDMKRSERNILYLWQGGLGMPDRDYYLLDKPEMKRVRAEYEKHIRKIWILYGAPARQADAKAATVMRIETRLAKASMDKVSLRDPHRVYHKKTLRELERHSPAVEWRLFLKRVGVRDSGHFVMGQPKFFAEVEAIIKTTPLPDLKTYLEWCLLDDAAALLSKKFVREDFRFYGTVLTGVTVMKSPWRRALSAANASVGDALGRLYVRRHFTPRAKRKMDALVSDLFAAYEERLAALDWMSVSTKRKALAKLRAMTRKIGYPRRSKNYRGLVILPDDYFGNVLRVGEYEHRRAMKKLGKPVDRHEWHMTPQTVNAYFNPGLNEIVFPAAILQPPFFDEAADDAVNYGAIGYTIGHEITHGFDDSGSKFDAHGNLKRWWTEEDRARFERKAAVLARQFDAYEIAGMRVNGKLTLGENIADLGGISIAFDAYQKRLARTGRKLIGEFSPEQRFFLGCAQGERELARAEFLKTILTTDPHSPAEFRVNGPFSNLPEFYRAFAVAQGDLLFRAPGKRAKIW